MGRVSAVLGFVVVAAHLAILLGHAVVNVNVNAFTRFTSRSQKFTTGLSGSPAEAIFRAVARLSWPG